MKDNKLSININRSAAEVFDFTVTPPNSTLWIPSIIAEETTELPIRLGTVYTLTEDSGDQFNVTVSSLEQDKIVEWVSTDNNYHCRYTYTLLDDNTTQLDYYEWVDTGEVESPMQPDALRLLKQTLESEA
jgi:hypothetical protein